MTHIPPTRTPTATATFYILWYLFLFLYKLHSSLKKKKHRGVLRWGSPCPFEINREGQKKCLSGQQGLNLLRGSGKQVLWVFVAVGWAAERSVDLPIGSAHQLGGLTENLLPAHTEGEKALYIGTDGKHSITSERFKSTSDQQSYAVRAQQVSNKEE